MTVSGKSLSAEAECWLKHFFSISAKNNRIKHEKNLSALQWKSKQICEYFWESTSWVIIYGQFFVNWKRFSGSGTMEIKLQFLLWFLIRIFSSAAEALNP